MLRVRSALFGVEGLSSKLQALVDQDTLLFRRSVELSAVVAEAKGFFAIENPEDPGRDPFPSMFLTDEMASLRSRFGAFDVCFDQCRLGLGFVKPTQVITNLPGLESLNGVRCNHGVKAHRPMEGVDEKGDFVTKSQSRYPPMLCERFARAFAEVFPQVAEDAVDDREDADEFA